MEVKIINKSLPYFVDYKDRKWLVDTGSLKNYIKPSLVPPNVTKYREEFVKTPAGTSKGSEYIYFEPDYVFPKMQKIKLYLFEFSPKYDVLLGHETLRHIKANVNFERNLLEYESGSKPLLLSIACKEIRLKPGFNVITIPVRSIPNLKSGLIKSVKNDEFNIEGISDIKK